MRTMSIPAGVLPSIFHRYVPKADTCVFMNDLKLILPLNFKDKCSMHICFLTHEYPLPGMIHGGVGSFIKTLGRKLVDSGHRVSVAGTGFEDAAYVLDEGINVYTLKNSGWKFASFIDNSRQLNFLLKKIHDTHPIHIVESPEYGLAFIKKQRKIKYFIRMHGGHHFFTIAEKRRREPWKVFQEKRSFTKADGVIAVSQYVADTTSLFLKIQSEVQVIHNPVNLQFFPKADGKKVVKNQLLFVGTVCEKKGIRQLIQALPMVKEHFGDVQLKIVGRDWKFPKTGASYKKYLEGFIDHSVHEHIHFFGAVPNEQIPFLLEEAEVCVFPSHMEAMPIAWIEALAMGKPVVGSKEGPGPEAILDGKTGLLADPYAPEDIAEKIIYMLSHKNEALEMGAAARKDILQRFDIEKCIDQNIAFYEKLTTNTKN